MFPARGQFTFLIFLILEGIEEKTQHILQKVNLQRSSNDWQPFLIAKDNSVLIFEKGSGGVAFGPDVEFIQQRVSGDDTGRKQVELVWGENGKAEGHSEGKSGKCEAICCHATWGEMENKCYTSWIQADVCVCVCDGSLVT